MKSIVLFALIAIMTTTSACRNKQERIDFKPLEEFLQRENSISPSNQKPPAWIVAYEDLLDTNGFNIVYSVNAKCSSCIVDFLYFYEDFQQANINASVYCFLDESFKVNIEYWMDKVEIHNKQKLSIVEAPKDFFQKQTGIPYGNIVLLRGYNPIKKLLVIENTVHIR